MDNPPPREWLRLQLAQNTRRNYKPYRRRREQEGAATKIQAALRMMMEKAMYPLRLGLAGLTESARKFALRYTVERG